MKISLVIIWTTLDRILWGIVLALQFICALKYLTTAKENEDFEERLISFSYAIIFFGIAISSVFILVAESLIPGTFVNHTFYGNYDKVNSTYKMCVRLYFFFFFGGFSFFIYAFERVLKRSKYILTTLYVIGLTLIILILPFELATKGLFFSLFTIFAIVLFLSILLLYTKWSRLELKAVSSLILMGSILISVGCLLVVENIKRQNISPLLLILAPVLCGLGTIICLTPTIVNPKVFSEALKYWTILGAITIGVMCIVEFYFIFYELPLDIIAISSALFLIVIFSVFYTLKSMKTQIIADKDKDLRPILEAFTKPKKVTEEEVSVSKEKKICLVCKGKLARDIYLCPDCFALYCKKCSKTLSDLENMCWVCETPFDESKPIKHYYREEEEVVVEEKIQKIGKDTQEN